MTISSLVIISSLIIINTCIEWLSGGLTYIFKIICYWNHRLSSGDFSSIYIAENRLGGKHFQYELSGIIEIKNSSEANFFILIFYTDIHKLIDKGTER